MISNNPFFPKKPVPPKFFVGRKFEIAVSLGQISQPGHLAIWGGRGMGKSSFLHLLASSAPSKAVIALVSCENIYPFTPSGFWREVLSVMKDNLESEPTLPAEVEKLLVQGQTTKDSLNKILQKLGKKDKSLLLLVDDFDVALQENKEYTEANMQQFLSECRSLAVASPGGKHLAMVVTSRKRLGELGPKLNLNASPWYNHYLFQHLKLLNDREIEQLLGVMPMTLELREAIKEIAGGHPTLLQIAGFLLYAQLQTDIKNNKVPDVQEFIENFERTTRDFFQVTWSMCSELEQSLLMLLALSNLDGRLHKKRNFDLSNIELIFTQKARELINLEEQGVIVRKTDEEKTVYSFASLMMQRWVVQEIWNTDEQLIKQRERVFLKLVSHKQLSQLNSIWQHKDEVLSTIEWFGKLVAAFPKGLI